MEKNYEQHFDDLDVDITVVGDPHVKDPDGIEVGGGLSDKPPAPAPPPPPTTTRTPAQPPPQSTQSTTPWKG